MSEISVIIPCYNENTKGNFIERMKKVENYLEKEFDNFELIIVDDGSTDDSFKQAMSLNNKSVKVIRMNRHIGKGSAIIKGFNLAKYEIVMFMDADLAVELDNIKIFYNKVRQGKCVIGERRTVKDNEQYWSSAGLVASKACTMIVNNKFKLEIKDSQCGFKMFSKKDIDSVIGRCKQSRFMLDVELLILLKDKIEIEEVPVRWRNNRNRAVHIKDWFISLIDIMKIRGEIDKC